MAFDIVRQEDDFAILQRVGNPSAGRGKEGEPVRENHQIGFKIPDLPDGCRPGPGQIGSVNPFHGYPCAIGEFVILISSGEEEAGILIYEIKELKLVTGACQFLAQMQGKEGYSAPEGRGWADQGYSFTRLIHTKALLAFSSELVNKKILYKKADSIQLE